MTSSTPEFRNSMVERLTLGIVKTLGKRQGITDIVVDHKGPADSISIGKWEAANCCVLPDDLKEFYLTSDGFLLTWKVKIKDDTLPIGHMEINGLSRLEKLIGLSTDSQHSNQSGISLYDIDIPEEEDPNGLLPHFDHRSRIFELDSCQNYGKMCLVYRKTKQGVPARDADYWFLDKSLRWHYVTDSFYSYFRLMITNLGLPQWHYLYTDLGVAPTVQQWYHLYTPSDSDSYNEIKGSEQSTTTSIDTSNNLIDINRVFKGKEKKKPAVSNSSVQPNAANHRRKTGSPLPNKNQIQRGQQPGNTGKPGPFSR